MHAWGWSMDWRPGTQHRIVTSARMRGPGGWHWAPDVLAKPKGCSTGTVQAPRMRPVRYEVVEVEVAARPVAGVRALVARGQVAQEFGRHLDQVYAAGRAGAVKLDGQNIFIYRSATADQLSVEFCVGVTAPFLPMGAVVPLETPGGTAAMTTHYGDYGALGHANAAIRDWCLARG